MMATLIDDTKKEFLKYLQEDRKIELDSDELSAISKVARIYQIADREILRDGKWLKVGKDFLLGDDGTGKYSRDVIWLGVIPDINDHESIGMGELARRLAKFRHK